MFSFCCLSFLFLPLRSGFYFTTFIFSNQSTFHYDSAFWRNTAGFNLLGGKTGFDHAETKLPTYWSTPFSKICLGMKIDKQLNFTLVEFQTYSSSLHSLIAANGGTGTSLGAEKWKNLAGSYSLPVSNVQEGFNLRRSKSSFVKITVPTEELTYRARIGFIGTFHQYFLKIGFGTGLPSPSKDLNTCGIETGGGEGVDKKKYEGFRIHSSAVTSELT